MLPSTFPSLDESFPAFDLYHPGLPDFRKGEWRTERANPCASSCVGVLASLIWRSKHISRNRNMPARHTPRPATPRRHTTPAIPRRHTTKGTGLSRDTAEPVSTLLPCHPSTAARLTRIRDQEGLHGGGWATSGGRSYGSIYPRSKARFCEGLVTVRVGGAVRPAVPLRSTPHARGAGRSARGAVRGPRVRTCSARASWLRREVSPPSFNRGGGGAPACCKDRKRTCGRRSATWSASRFRARRRVRSIWITSYGLACIAVRPLTTLSDHGDQLLCSAREPSRRRRCRE